MNRPSQHNLAFDVQCVGVAKPKLTGLVLAASDVATLSAVCSLTVMGRWLVGGQYPLKLYFQLWPLLGLFVAAYAVSGLYPGAPVSPTKEVRKLSLATTMVFLTLGTILFLNREAQVYSRSVLVAALMLSLVAVPMARNLVRIALSWRSWWGYTAVIIGVDATMHRMIRRFRRQPELGLKPAAVFSPNVAGADRYMRLPVMHEIDQLIEYARDKHICYAIVSTAGLGHKSPQEIEAMLEKLSATFKHLIVIPQVREMASLWASTMDLDGTLGLCVEHRLLDRGQRLLKRLLDLVLIAHGLPIVVPLMIGIAIAIRLDSPGPIVFRQHRLGRNGKPFKVFKFRTMVVDAEAKLQQHLKDNPQLQQEWDRYQKLQDDPRITAVGRWLRKTSLDELPQVFNVLLGDMSLVGPRPIIEEEIARYGRYYKVYCAVPPGITGIWQVSGRNLVPYHERVQMDVYYVRNWSTWLDLHLIARTVSAILLQRGAQ